MARDTVAFISYARQDGEAFATDLRQRVEKEQPEISLWQDRARMRGGEDFPAQIKEAIDSVQYLVLVLTPAALRSPWVQKEWRYAREQGVCVCPVKGVADADLSALRAALPNWMSQAHAYDLKTEWERFVLFLKSPCQATRVPFMAEDLRAGYVERLDETARIVAHLLDAQRQNPSGKRVAILGAPGFGKTTLAVKACHDGEVMSACDGGILWTTLGEQPSVQPELTKLYAALTNERPQFVDAIDASIELSKKLDGKRCLMVIDDVWDLEHAKPFLRGGDQCTRLITTRNAKIAADVAEVSALIKVGEMKPEEAERLLAAGIEPAPADFARFRELAARLGEWPMLIELANSAIRDQLRDGETLEAALDWIGLALKRLGVVAFDRDDAKLRNQAVQKTVEVSLSLLKEKRQRCLELAIFPDDTAIPFTALAIIWGADEFETKRLSQRLNELSLVRLNLPQRNLLVHDAMRDYFKGKLEDSARFHGMLADAWKDPARRTDEYAQQNAIYHVVESMAETGQIVARADQLLHLLTDSIFRKYQEVRGDPVALNRQISRAVENLVESTAPQAAILLAALAIQRESFTVERLPRWIFDLAREGKLGDAVERLALFDCEPEWMAAAELLIAWLAPDQKATEAQALAEKMATVLNEPELKTLLEWVRLRPEGVPSGLAPLQSSPQMDAVSAILARAGGGEGNATGIEPLDREMLGSLMASGIDPNERGFIAEGDGGPLVAFARLDPPAHTQYLRRYIAIHAANRYRYYRNRSLWALMKFVLSAPEAAWVEQVVEDLVTSALTVTTVDFRDAVPLAVWALRARAGDVSAVANLEQYHQQLVAETQSLSPERGKSDSWAHCQRSAAALAEAFAGIGRIAESSTLLKLARDLPKGFAGFRASAALTLTETVKIVQPADSALREQFLESAQAASHRIQDFPFCLQTVAQVNAVQSRWWPDSGMALESLIDRFVRSPRAAEFCAVHRVRVPLKYRGTDSYTLPIPKKVSDACTLRELADIHRLKPEELMEANREHSWDLDQQLAPGTSVNIPDPDFVPLLAARFAAEALATSPLERRTQLIQRLVLPAAANRTTMDTVLARLLLSTIEVPMPLPPMLLSLEPAPLASEITRSESIIA